MNLLTVKPFSETELTALFDRIKRIRVGILGDLCLDVYWRADMRRSELSRETPHFPLPVVEELMYPGGGGNVAANLSSLEIPKVRIIGAVGCDWRGTELMRLLNGPNMDISGIVRSGGLVTNAFCKPLRRGISGVEYEDPRLDFANHGPLPPEIEAEIIGNLTNAASDIDVLCVSDQVMYGAVTPAIREIIMGFAEKGLKTVIDSRDRICEYKGRNIVLKPNEVEGQRALGIAPGGSEGTAELAETAKVLSERLGCDVCMTVGPRGSLTAEYGSDAVFLSPAVKPDGPVDICGAGDTFLAAFAAAAAAGEDLPRAAAFAGLASGVTVRKIGVTGTASPAEILNCCNFIPNYC